MLCGPVISFYCFPVISFSSLQGLLERQAQALSLVLPASMDCHEAEEHSERRPFLSLWRSVSACHPYAGRPVLS